MILRAVVVAAASGIGARAAAAAADVVVVHAAIVSAVWTPLSLLDWVPHRTIRRFGRACASRIERRTDERGPSSSVDRAAVCRVDDAERARVRLGRRRVNFSG